MKTTSQHVWRALATHVVGTAEAGGLAGIATFAGAAWIGVALPALHVENAFGAVRDNTPGIALEAAMLGIRSTPAAGAPLQARKQLPFLLDPNASRIVGLTIKPQLPDDPSRDGGSSVIQIDPAVSVPAPEPPSVPAPIATPPVALSSDSTPSPAPEAPTTPSAEAAPPVEPPTPQKPSGGDTAPPSNDSTPASSPPAGWGSPSVQPQIDTSDGTIVGGSGDDSSDNGATSDPADGGTSAGTGAGNGNGGGNANAGGNNPNAGGANAGGNGKGKGH